MKITLDIPAALYERLQTQAQQSGMSLNHEIIAVLTDAVAHEHEAVKPESLLEQVRHIRLALGVSGEEIDLSGMAAHLGSESDLPPRETFWQSLPRLHPPLSATIVEDREDRI